MEQTIKMLDYVFKNEYSVLVRDQKQGKWASYYEEALYHFDELDSIERIILQKFNEYRHDFVSSDNEVVAFVTALKLTKLIWIRHFEFYKDTDSVKELKAKITKKTLKPKTTI